MKKPSLTAYGYKTVFEPTHPKAWKNCGSIFEHRLVAEKMMGRQLRDNEDVHHPDEDKTNNRPENLLVLEKSQHSKLHSFLQKHILIPINPFECTEKMEMNEFCQHCGKELTKTKFYCSSECSFAGRSKRPNELTPERLYLEIQSTPASVLANKYNVSDKTIEKWCKKDNISKPGRGFWIKLKYEGV